MEQKKVSFLSNRSNGKKQLIAAVAALAIIGSGFAGGKAVFAAESTTNTAITGGSLSMTDPAAGSFTPVTLDGTVQQSTASLDNFTVTDSTGTGNGWNVMVKATPFTNTEKNSTLPDDSLALAGPTVTAHEGASDVNTITVANGTIDNTTGIKVLSAAANGGMGIYDIAFPNNPLSLTLNPKDVKAGTYTSTITVTVTTGP